MGTNWLRAIIVGVYPPAMLDAACCEAAVVYFFTTTRPVFPTGAAASFESWGAAYYAPIAAYFLPLAALSILGVLVTFKFERFLPPSENCGAIILRIRF